MEITNSLILTFLELTFVFVALLVLYGQRKNIGETPFYIALGLLLVFGQFLMGADLRFSSLEIEGVSLNFAIAPVVIFMPFLAVLLLLYITEGALAAQRLIIGSLVAMGLFFYLGDLTRLQVRWITYSVSGTLPLETLDLLLEHARRSMLATAVTQLVELFLVPIIYSRLRNSGHKLFVSCFGALGIALVADSLLFILLTGVSANHWFDMFYPMVIAKALAILWLSILLSLYIAKFSEENEARHGRTLEILFAFFGSYGRTKLLEANLLEWEGRYRMILENASEMILMIDRTGRILDANRAACRMLGESALPGSDFATHLVPEDGEVFRNLFQLSEPVEDTTRILYLRAPRPAGEGAEASVIHLALTVTPLAIGELETFIVLGRDITEEHHLEEERQRLNDELAHSQRLEALGQLAGGVAHDFNNNIHAILGHADLIGMSAELDDKSQRHLEKIVEIAEQSGQLTSQLLGFARKGKYLESDFDLRILVQRTVDIFLPSAKEIAVSVNIADHPLMVRGDKIQLQQVFLNLLINARDAMRGVTDREHTIDVRLAEAAGPGELPQGLRNALAEFDLEKTILFSIADNGCGIDEATKKRLFEPFFTTKPMGQGTGMALAMAYGTISSHHGIIHVESVPGAGTTFYIALPLLEE